jgi:uncharacterized protein (TIGR02147 family)
MFVIIENMIKIYHYIDYRKLLKDYYTINKRKTRYFTYRYFAEKVGINSPGFIKDVMDGKRNLTVPMIEKFGSGLDLSKKEATFFRHLVQFNQAKSIEVKQEHYRVIVSMMTLVNEFELPADHYEYFDKWYTCVVRELICIYNFKENYTLLGTMVKPAIKTKEAHDAVDLLLRLSLIKKEADGTYSQTQKALTGGVDLHGMVLYARRSFNRSMMERALDTLESLPVTERNISGITMGLSKSGYDIILAELAAFKERVITIANQDKDLSRVYQFNFQIFPLSEDTRLTDGIDKRPEQ